MPFNSNGDCLLLTHIHSHYQVGAWFSHINAIRFIVAL
jgi:hypothetical protein